MQQPVTSEQLNHLMAKLVAELCSQGLLTQQDSEDLLRTPAAASSPSATQRRSARDERLSAIERSLAATPGIIEQGRREIGRSKDLLLQQHRPEPAL